MIERLAFGGAGVGRLEGKACFVPLSAPGDLLKVKVVKEHRSFIEARVSEIIVPSSVRVTPFCHYFGNCGGCDWQHIAYDAQCQAKHSILADSLSRIGLIKDPPVDETFSAAISISYRARAQFKLFKADDGLKAGFFRRSSRHVVNLPDGCPLVTDRVNAGLKSLVNLVSTLPDADRIPQITIDEGEDGAYAIVHYTGNKNQILKEFLSENQLSLPLAALFIQSGRKDSLQRVFGSKRVTYTVPAKNGDLLLGYDIGGFSQVNREQNREMARLVRKLAGSGIKASLLDLYCGNGNLSLPLSDVAIEMTGIEEYAPSIASAVDNSGQASINNSTFICADASEGLKELLEAGRRFDLLLLDPPRSGAADIIRTVSDSGAEDIIYVSCDPSTLARDLAFLTGQHLYKLEVAVPLDMFPHTGHLETVALLKRI